MKMRNLNLMLAAFGLTIATAGTALADTPCEDKENRLERRMSYAIEVGDMREAKGLEQALDSVRKWCGDDETRAHAHISVMDSQDKVREREMDLARAIAAGKPAGTIQKRQRKLEEARQDLLEAERIRDGLR